MFPGTKTGTRVRPPKPPFIETALLSPNEPSWCWQKGGFQKGGFGGCSPGTKTGTRVRLSPSEPRKGRSGNYNSHETMTFDFPRSTSRSLKVVTTISTWPSSRGENSNCTHNDRQTSESSRSLWLFPGSARGFPTKISGKSQESCWKMFPELRNALNSRIWGTGKGRPAANLLPHRPEPCRPSARGCFWKRQFQPSRVFLKTTICPENITQLIRKDSNRVTVINNNSTRAGVPTG